MPELPDITVYVEALRERTRGRTLIRALVRSPFLLRSADPPLGAAYGKTVREVRRLGKRIALGLTDDLWLVLHLMIAGRLHWNMAAPKAKGRNVLATFEFDSGWLWLTEAGTQHRASLHIVAGEAGLAAFSAGGVEPLDGKPRRTSRRRCVRRITRSSARSPIPHIFSGIGNAYSDEILHRAQLSPIAMTQKLGEPRARAALRRHAYDAHRMDRSSARRIRGWVPRKGNRVSSGDGGARPLRPAVSALRRQGPAHPAREQ